MIILLTRHELNIFCIISLYTDVNICVAVNPAFEEDTTRYYMVFVDIRSRFLYALLFDRIDYHYLHQRDFSLGVCPYLRTRKVPLNFVSQSDLFPDPGIFKEFLPLLDRRNSAYSADSSSSCRPTVRNCFRMEEDVTSINPFDFGTDPDHDRDTNNLTEFYHCAIRPVIRFLRVPNWTET